MESATTGTPSRANGIRGLACNQVIRLERRSRIKRIEIKTGVVWLTSTPANGDVFLRAGDVFECQKDWPYILQALEPSEFSWSCA